MLEASNLGEAWALCFVANQFTGPMYRAMELEAGISRPEFVVLLCVGQFDGLVAQDVAEMSGLPRNTISRGVNRLLAERLLLRAPSAGGARDQVLALSDSGEALRQRLMQHPERRRQRMLAQITPRERDVLEMILLKIARASPSWAGEDIAPVSDENPIAPRVGKSSS